MKRLLALLLVLCTLAAPVLAEGSLPMEALLAPFYQGLVDDGLIDDAGPLADLRNAQDDFTVNVSFDLAEWLSVTLQSEEPFVRMFHLYLSGYYLPNDVDRDDIFTRFLSAIAPEAEAPADTIAWLRDNFARTSLYSVDAARDIPGNITVTRSESLSNDESFMTVIQYMDFF